MYILNFHHFLVCCTPEFSDSFATQSSQSEDNNRIKYYLMLNRFWEQYVMMFFSEKLVQNYVLSLDSAVNNLHGNAFVKNVQRTQ